MALSVGQRLPEASLHRMGPEGPEQVETSALLAGRKVVIFGFVGAFTGDCQLSHIPSFVRTRAAFGEKGVDEIIGISVNDPFVMAAFAETTGAASGNVTLLADPGSEFTRAIGMDFDAPVVGFYGRSKRYAILADDGVITAVAEEPDTFTCEMTLGEAFLVTL